MQLDQMQEFFHQFILNFELFAIGYLFLANSSYLIILIMGLINSRKQFLKSEQNNASVGSVVDLLKPVSILVPAYNEEETVCESVYSLLRLNYPSFEVIVVNDGSKDETINRLIEEFDLQYIFFNPPKVLPTKNVKGTYVSKNYPNLFVVDKENGGKADALNSGINFSNFPLICCIDSDTILDENGLIQLSYPFFENPSEMLAVGGTIRVVNHTKVEHGRVQKISVGWNYLSLIQIVEYLRAFLVGRMGWDYINATTIISGAFGLFRKKAVIKVGGYGTNTIGEDLELLLRIHDHYLKRRKKYQVRFLPDPVCWTEVPSSFSVLGKQRTRWQQGLMEGIWINRRMLFKPWSGVIGNIALPYLLLFELFSAPIELFGYIVTIIGFSLGLISTEVAGTFLVVSMLYGWILTLGALIIEEITFRKYKDMKDYFKLFVGVLLEQFGYHQINLFWRLRGMWRFFRGHRSWGEMTRSGFKKKEAA